MPNNFYKQNAIAGPGAIDEPLYTMAPGGVTCSICSILVDNAGHKEVEMRFVIVDDSNPTSGIGEVYGPCFKVQELTAPQYTWYAPYQVGSFAGGTGRLVLRVTGLGAWAIRYAVVGQSP